MVYAIAIKQTFPNHPLKPNSRYFVIADSRLDFNAELWKIDTLGPLVIAAIESVQPYHRPHPGIPAPLSILRELSNTDKHKLLRLAATLPKLWDGKFAAPEDPTIERRFFLRHGPLVDGAEVAAAISSKSDPHMMLTAGSRIGFVIAMWTVFFGDGEKILVDDWVDFISLLRILINEVEEVIGLVAKAA